MSLKIKLNESGYTLYCPELDQYVYSSAGRPGYSNFPRPTCVFPSVEKAQNRIDTFIQKEEDNIAIANNQLASGYYRIIETAEYEVTYANQKLDLAKTFLIVKLAVTCVE